MDKKAPDLIALRRKHGAVVIGDVTVEKCISGMRGITGMFSETSLFETFYVGELSASVTHSQSIGDVTLRTCSKTSPPSTSKIDSRLSGPWNMTVLPTVSEARLLAFWSVPPKLQPRGHVSRRRDVIQAMTTATGVDMNRDGTHDVRVHGSR